MKNAFTLAACALYLSSCATVVPPDGPSATAVMRPASGTQAHGAVKFTQVGTRVRVDAEIAGLSPGSHGIHVHAIGDCTAPDAACAGPHFNPGLNKHGPPDSAERHSLNPISPARWPIPAASTANASAGRFRIARP